ncbi:FAD_binding_4 domain-containing protein/BBE domain-containing protein [Cephalotus follicularis]|uniref:FAD_binding_4 domain-containing protein/BBE domain-containing protein n=1 Tax=Cephalotus follicularis TaxID=3775 RepID=A0A1Q3BC42_CEPFO|nr:FAD_binding_4 domain-containing protein/BBE domain-containing protein [Cephalotus follicularis]
MEIPNPTSCVLFLVLVFFSSSSFSSAQSSDATVYQMFLQCLSNQTKSPDVSNIIYSQSNPAYTAVLRAYIRNARFNTSATRKPTIIITPKQETHVQAAVICTKQVGFRLKIRSGGHDYEGISYRSDNPFFILDMNNMRDIVINMSDETAWVGVGATLGEVYYRISEKSKLHGYPGGVCPTVGVGGHVSGGGYGNMIRKYGLTVDNVVDAKIVDVKGNLLDRKSMGEDLFWAIRGGGGGSFGAIVAYKIKLVKVPETVTIFRLERTLTQNATDIALKWQSVAPKIDPNLWMRMLLEVVTVNNDKTCRIAILAEYLEDANSLVALLGEEFPELGLKKENCTEMSWIESAVWWGGLDIGTKPEALLDRDVESADFFKMKSDYVQTPIPREGLEGIWKKMIELEKGGLEFNAYGGRMNEIPATETPVAHRAGNLFKVQYSISWNNASAELEKTNLGVLNTLFTYMTPYVSKNPRGAYLNYRDLDIGVNNFGKDTYAQGEVYGRKYFNVNFERLVEVKTAVDPENFFGNEQSIRPLTSKK